ncbi:hypothetical protein [Brevundimonas variabilis]|uniref:Uncharacterized protein n=1 Tax=Brevundimonas variabilis TaxID=74312 RepID=A0A7W9CI66_9CAUL|nr:hypothetical protein [Brevundimonas variabilis]MBB5746092.1 hypothetical protein [Brevundimonas variabilis]
MTVGDLFDRMVPDRSIKVVRGTALGLPSLFGAALICGASGIFKSINKE